MDRDKQSCRVMRKLNSNMSIETIYLNETTDKWWGRGRMRGWMGGCGEWLGWKPKGKEELKETSCYVCFNYKNTEIYVQVKVFLGVYHKVKLID